MPRRRIFILLALGFLSADSFAGKAHFEESRVPNCILQNLDAWEQSKKNKASVEFELPATLRPISIGRTEALRDFNVGVALFRDHWGDSTIQELRRFAEIKGQRNLEMQDRQTINAQVKEARAAVKTLRFLYKALSKEHQCPPALDELATAMGKYRDVVQGKRGNVEDLDGVSDRLAAALRDKNLARLEKELRDFQPTTRKSFDAWIKDTLSETRKIVLRDKGKAGEYHDVRKNLQMLLAVYQVELNFHPEKPEWKQVANFLLKKSENIGDKHETWERASAQRHLDYDKSTVEFSSELNQEILDFIRRIKFN